ncbi:MAG TPA: formate dehydrogenase [Noviherbaspirillum sp.]|jgi:hypothetical protein|uniref:formate dehydrogenase n=1 Tax=Noviherbaspirillum sp. TaxID=1926288 RepID=UPI002F94C151
MNQAPAVRRRSFLAAALCLPVAAAAAALVARRAAPLPAASPLPEDKPTGGGYHETEHIRKYYRSAAYF